MRPGFAVMLDGLLIIGLLSYSKIGGDPLFQPCSHNHPEDSVCNVCS